MKKLFSLSLMLLISFVVYGQDTSSCETDEFTGETNCKTEVVNLSSAESNVSRTIFQMVYQSESQTYFMAFAFASSEWQYLNTEKIYFLLDGERENYELLSVDSDISGGTVVEQYGIQLVSEDIERFLNAEEIRFKIRNDIYEFNSEAKGILNSLKTKVDELED